MINIATFSKGTVPKRTAPNTGGRASCQDTMALRRCRRFYDLFGCRLPTWDLAIDGIAAHGVRGHTFEQKRPSPTISDEAPSGANQLDHEETVKENSRNDEGF